MKIMFFNLATQPMISLLDNMFTDYAHVIGCTDGTHHVEIIHPDDVILIKHKDMLTLIRNEKTVTIKENEYYKVNI